MLRRQNIVYHSTLCTHRSLADDWQRDYIQELRSFDIKDYVANIKIHFQLGKSWHGSASHALQYCSALTALSESSAVVGESRYIPYELEHMS